MGFLSLFKPKTELQAVEPRKETPVVIYRRPPQTVYNIKVEKGAKVIINNREYKA